MQNTLPGISGSHPNKERDVKKKLAKWAPTPQKLREHRSLRFFGSLLDRGHLWQLSRLSAARAFAIGLYCAMLPIPGQMFVSVALAIRFRANLPLSFALIFITNPLTMPPIFFAAYELGAWLTDTSLTEIEFHASWSWLSHSLGDIWLPLIIGSQVMGICLALAGYFLIDQLWRNAVRRQWHARKLRRGQ